MENILLTEPWIVVPAYNEGRVIETTVRELCERYAHVVVIDDGSGDDTSERARSAGAIVLRHVANQGQGAALATGMTFAVRRGAAAICTFDADGQHELEAISRMAQRLYREQLDVVLSSRFIGGEQNVPPIKRIVLKMALAFTRMHTGLPLTDTHNGLRVMTGTAARLLIPKQKGMAHASEILDGVARNKLKWVEEPALVRYTAYSVSKGQRISNSIKIVLELLYARITRL